MRSYSAIFIDLDQTLYPASSGIWEDVASKINIFLEQKFDISSQEAFDLRMRYYRDYGTTLRGLQDEENVDPIHYMQFIHDVPIEQKIQIDPDLPDLLSKINIPKYVFTNASIDHAERVLNHLDLETCFDDIIDIIRLDYANKPDPAAYHRALRIAGNPDPRNCVLVDDSLSNLRGGSKLGMTTVHVGKAMKDEFAPDHQIESIHKLFDVLPELKNSHESTGD